MRAALLQDDTVVKNKKTKCQWYWRCTQHSILRMKVVVLLVFLWWLNQRYLFNDFNFFILNEETFNTFVLLKLQECFRFVKVTLNSGRKAKSLVRLLWIVEENGKFPVGNQELHFCISSPSYHVPLSSNFRPSLMEHCRSLMNLQLDQNFQLEKKIFAWKLYRHM